MAVRLEPGCALPSRKRATVPAPPIAMTPPPTTISAKTGASESAFVPVSVS